MKVVLRALRLLERITEKIMPLTQQIRSAFFLATIIMAAVLSPQGLKAQAFSAQITGSPTWQKGTSSVTWSYSGTPSSLVSQYGVKVVVVSMAGSATTYMLTPQAVAISARQANIATNFTYTQNTALQIVLEDLNGNKLTAPYSVTFRAPTTVAAPVSAPVVSGNPALATAACNYVFGQGCTGSYAQFGTYLIAPGNSQMFPTQAAMQSYLINFVGTSPGAKTDIINRASGSQPCTVAVSALNGAFTANANNPQGNGLWNSYAQLASMAPSVVKSRCTVTAAASASPAQLAAALSAAFAKLALQAATPAQTSALSKVTDPNAMEGAVRSYISADATLRGQIVVNVYRQIFATLLAPAATTQSQLLAIYGSRWTAADDLYAFLNANKAAYTAAPASLSVKSFSMISGMGSRCLAVQNGSTTPGAQLVLWACNASAAEQQFTFMGDGSIRPFGNRYGTGLCLDILDPARDGKTMVSGDHPQIFACNGQQNQKFNFSNGTIQTTNGWCFDLWGGNAVSFLSGAINVQLYHCTAGANNQRFVAGVVLPVGQSFSLIPANLQTNITALGSAPLISLNGSATIVAQGGGNIVAQGGGNIVAQGGGNIVAQGGGNIQSAGNDGMVIVPIASGIVAQGGGN